MPRTGRPSRPPVERFTRQTLGMPTGCIEWVGHVDRYGYGQFRPGGRDTTKVGAHRWAYLHFVGPIPDGFQIDHLCRNRRCVNPEHLESVTPRENTMRGLNPASLNAKKTHCIHGHPFSVENTDIRGNRRVCRTCRRTRDLARYHARKALT